MGGDREGNLRSKIRKNEKKTKFEIKMHVLLTGPQLGNFFENQDILSLVIIFFILITYLFDEGENRFLSLLGLKD